MSCQHIFINTKRTAQTDSLRSVTALTLCWIKISKIPDYSANNLGRLQYHWWNYVFSFSLHCYCKWQKRQKNLPILKRIFNKLILQYFYDLSVQAIIWNLLMAGWSSTASTAYVMTQDKIASTACVYTQIHFFKIPLLKLLKIYLLLLTRVHSPNPWKKHN